MTTSCIDLEVSPRDKTSEISSTTWQTRQMTSEGSVSSDGILAIEV
jgi:hypothetical protein